MSSPVSMEACKSYAHGAICDALACYDVVKYQSALITEVNDLCLEMGCLCKGDKARYQRLAKELTGRVYGITADEAERTKIFNYVSKIIRVGSHYGILTGQ